MANQSQSCTVIDNKLFRGRQSRNLIRILKTARGHKLRLHVKRDSYDFQSYAKIEIWSESEGRWNFVYSIPFPEMACVKSSSEDKIEDDAKELLQTALLIIE